MNAIELFVFRWRNKQDLDCFIDETSALLDKKQLNEIYKIATDEPYSFLYIKLNSKEINNMFYINFNKTFKVR